MIGLIDQDALLRRNFFVVNLEIMKLGTYFKKKNKIVELLLDASDNEKYTKIYLRKNRFDNNFPSLLLLDPRVEYGGYAFTKDTYLPLEEEIENTKPTTHIYDNYIKGIHHNEVLSKFYRASRGSHLRLSLDNKTIINDYYKFINYDSVEVFIYDILLTKLSNSLAALQDLSRRFPISTIYPIKFYSIKDIEEWRQLKTTEGTFYSIYKVTSDEEFLFILKLFDKQRNKINFCFGDTHFFNDRDFFIEATIILKRIIYSKVNGLNIRFFVSKNFTNSKFYWLFKTLSAWSMAFAHKNSFYNFCITEGYKNLTKDKAQFLKLINEDFEFKTFYDVSPQLIKEKGGIWRL